MRKQTSENGAKTNISNATIYSRKLTSVRSECAPTSQCGCIGAVNLLKKKELIELESR